MAKNIAHNIYLGKNHPIVVPASFWDSKSLRILSYSARAAFDGARHIFDNTKAIVASIPANFAKEMTAVSEGIERPVRHCDTIGEACPKALASTRSEEMSEFFLARSINSSRVISGGVHLVISD